MIRPEVRRHLLVGLYGRGIGEIELAYAVDGLDFVGCSVHTLKGGVEAVGVGMCVAYHEVEVVLVPEGLLVVGYDFILVVLFMSRSLLAMRDFCTSLARSN